MTASVAAHGAPSAWFNPTLFSGRVAFIVGGGSGIGASVCAMLARYGCAVAVGDRIPEGEQEVAARIVAAGGTSLAVTIDVTQPELVTTAVALVAGWRGCLDLVVNCAGVTLGGELATLPIEDWHEAMNVNFHGPFHVARAVFPHLKEQAGSAMVNIGSIASAGAYPGGGSYAASKAALLVLSKQLAVEWAPEGIRVNSVSPGTTLTPLLNKFQTEESKKARAKKVPLKRLAEPEELANAICFLLSRAATLPATRSS